ncbi:LOG family protein [Microlunatus spumicola]|uniref:LOG family protein n=1 Tax=Microlunatus spumicola TaxID=81499 RepID=A0ABP6Y9L8_9ACTN
MSSRSVEIDSLADFDTRLADDGARLAGRRRLTGWFVSSVDLRDRTDALLAADPRGAVFLGCLFAGSPVDVAERLRSGGALLFPELPDLPFDPYRPRLYSPEELYGVVDGQRPPYALSPDSTTYAWSRAPHGRSLTADLAATLHDHSIGGALDDATEGLDPTRVVGVMGGHAVRRSDPAYAATARLGAGLTRAGRTVLTGGGPGAMEAANLGAYLSGWDDALPEALAQLAGAPGWADGVDAWADAALAVRARWSGDQAGRSISIPTWFYGHEPTNVFGTAIAKYFANALREDTLLHRCRGGIVFAPGSAGTVQEIFQAANDRFYAVPGSAKAPLVLLGSEHWQSTLPAWPLLEALSRDSPMAGAVHVVDDPEEALALVTG